VPIVPFCVPLVPFRLPFVPFVPQEQGRLPALPAISSYLIPAEPVHFSPQSFAA